MRVLVLGAGVIGVTSAYELARDGHQVTVIDANKSAAEGTSFANAGMVAVGHAFAWASPRAPRMMLRSIFGSEQPIRFRPRLSPDQWAWGLRFLRECTAERARRNTSVKHRLCSYSQKMLHRVVQETGIQYNATREGLLYFHRSPETFDRGVTNMRFLEQMGQKIEVIDTARVIALEPSLAPQAAHIAGGIYAGTDESGDANLFTRRLFERCVELGVTFRMGETVRRLVENQGVLERVITDRSEYTADACVVALGPHSARLTRQVGVSLPIYPVKGYSVTFPLREGRDNALTRGVVDEDNLLAVTPIGSMLRATSVAEITGYDDSHHPAQFAPMVRKLRALFPDAADYDKPSYWAGLRPMTPDGPPRIGKSRVGGLFVNTGQGHMGWTMACGSARILADIVGQKTPEIDTKGLEVRAA